MISNVSAMESKLLANTSVLEQDIINNASSLVNLVKVNSSRLEQYIISNVSAMESKLLANTSVLEQDIINNASSLVNLVKVNSSRLEQYIISNVSAMESKLLANTSVLEQDIINNASSLVNLVKVNSSRLEQYIISNVSAMESKLLANTSVLEQDIINNASSLVNLVKVNSSRLEQYIISNVSAMESKLLANTSVLEQDIINNASSLVNLVKVNSSRLEQYIISNVSAMESKLLANTSVLEQDIINNASSLVNLVKVNSSRLEQYIISNVSAMESKLLANTSVLEQDINLINQQLITLNQQLQIQINNMQFIDSEIFFVCSSAQYTFKSFNISQTTNIITASSYSNNFVFDQYISNAQIEVQSINSAFTMFKNQSVFYNLNIQLSGLNFVSSGAILTYSSTINVQQVNIIQKIGTLSINSGKALSIISNTTTDSQIKNLLINLTFSQSSQGQISLIFKIVDLFNINGYQIFGSIISKECIGLIANTINNSIIFVKNLKINLHVFQVGNQSSYLISQVINSNATFNHIIVGFDNIINIIISISSTSNNKVNFGGLVCFTNTSQISIYDIQLMQHETWSTDYVQNTGLLVGQIINNISSVSISSICINYNLITEDTNFNIFGIIGQTDGYLAVINSNINILFSKGLFNGLGLICGHITQFNSYAKIQQIYICLKMSENDGEVTSAIVGFQDSNYCNIKEIEIFNSSLYGAYILGYVCALVSGKVNIYTIQIQQSNISVYSQYNRTYGGGNIGFMNSNTQIVVQYSKFFNSVIAARSQQVDAHVGGILGFQSSYSLLQVQNVQVESVNISSIAPQSQSILGGIVGISYFTLLIQNTQLSMVQGDSSAQVTQFSGGILGNSIGMVHLTTIINVNTFYVKLLSNSFNIYNAGLIAYINNLSANINGIYMFGTSLNCYGTNINCKLLLNQYSSSIFVLSSSGQGNQINGMFLNDCIFNNIDSQSGC
ncbi:Conserved_hypothetical protein [Hexamita inflata]|uniref:Uncharacterized protein n=1 Tax=Hexamita inflata TaxID=28002 RepID=A0AA86PJD6_9EUKA|nr:Conserved hypothetical protein [Hexamita inflata]